MPWPKGVPHRRVLHDEDLAVLASAAPVETVAALAERLGKPYYTVAHALAKIRRDGWICPVAAVACTECGELLTSRSGSGRRRSHPACISARSARRGRQRRIDRAPGSLSTPYVRRYRVEHPDQTRVQREKDKARMRELFPTLPPEVRRELVEKVHAADQRDYPITLDAAAHSGEPWDAEEDVYILEHRRMPARDIGLHLGRTLWAVRNRRSKLLRAEALAPLQW